MPKKNVPVAEGVIRYGGKRGITATCTTIECGKTLYKKHSSGNIDRAMENGIAHVRATGHTVIFRMKEEMLLGKPLDPKALGS